MKHAFLILAHKNFSQLMQMIAALQSKKSLFFVHIDKKSEMLRHISQAMIESPSNIMLSDRQVNVNWGGFSMIEATVCLMNMLRDSGVCADYVHLLSGQDLPLCPPQEIDLFFENNYGKNFMEYHTIPCKGWENNGGLDRINYKWDVDGGETDRAKLESRPFLTDIHPYGGSQWWSLTGECVEWMISMCHSGNLLYDFYRNTNIPDEMLFQTAIMHSPFATTVVNDNLRYINWTDGPEYPRILRNEDWDKLRCSGKLFARKFDICKDANIMNKILIHNLNT